MANYYKFVNGLEDANAYWVSGKPYITGALTVLPFDAPATTSTSAWIGAGGASTSGSVAAELEWGNENASPTTGVGNAEGVPDDTWISASATPATGPSDFLLGRGYGFSIPGDATITGFEVKVVHSIGLAPRTITDETVSISKDTTGGDTTNLAGSNLADTSTSWPPMISPTTASYGATDNLWGQTWTPAEVNAANFGICFRADLEQRNGAARVDGIQIICHYTSNDIINTVTRLQFPTVTNWVEITNGDNADILRYALSINGISGSTSDTGEWGLIPPQTTVGPLSWKITDLYLSADDTSNCNPVTVVAGLTDIPSGSIADNWSGSVGVG